MANRKKTVFSEKHIQTWLQNPSINPKTGKAIKTNGPTYMLLETAYNKLKTKKKSKTPYKPLPRKKLTPLPYEAYHL